MNENQTPNIQDDQFNWEIKNEVDVAFAIVNLVQQVVNEQMVYLADLFPFRGQWTARFIPLKSFDLFC